MASFQSYEQIDLKREPNHLALFERSTFREPPRIRTIRWSRVRMEFHETSREAENRTNTEHRVSRGGKWRQRSPFSVSIVRLSRRLCFYRSLGPARRPEVTGHFSKHAEMRCPSVPRSPLSKVPGHKRDELRSLSPGCIVLLVRLETTTPTRVKRGGGSGWWWWIFQLAAGDECFSFLLRKSRDARNFAWSGNWGGRRRNHQ